MNFKSGVQVISATVLPLSCENTSLAEKYLNFLIRRLIILSSTCLTYSTVTEVDATAANIAFEFSADSTLKIKAS